MGDNGRMGGSNVWLAGVDGCRAGWVVAFVRATGDEAPRPRDPALCRHPDRAEHPAVIAVDMPIGLPDRTGYGGRAAENAIRPLLGARQSAVFSVPSRAAMEQTEYREACAAAFATSDPPRKISKQLFMIAPKIREVDACLRDDPSRGRARVRSPSRTGVLAAERRAGADRAEEGQGTALRTGAGAAPGASGRSGTAARRCAGRAAAGRCTGRSARRAGLRRNRAPHSCRARDGRSRTRRRSIVTGCGWRSGRDSRAAFAVPPRLRSLGASH